MASVVIFIFYPVLKPTSPRAGQVAIVNIAGASPLHLLRRQRGAGKDKKATHPRPSGTPSLAKPKRGNGSEFFGSPLFNSLERGVGGGEWCFIYLTPRNTGPFQRYLSTSQNGL